jgi:ElaB/YqjD/DUF883 family membrane-anchored ribosome-binding protein
MEVSANKLMDELRSVIADAEELLRVTADQGGAKVQEVRERAEESLRAAREHLSGAGRELDSQVHEHPWAAVGVAVGVGLIVGVLLSRK